MIVVVAVLDTGAPSSETRLERTTCLCKGDYPLYIDRGARDELPLEGRVIRYRVGGDVLDEAKRCVQ